MGAVTAETHSPEIKRRVSAGRKQPFARALGLHKKSRLNILDATAGLGRDSMVMLGLGCSVTLMERNPVTHALLQNALLRAAPEINASSRLLECTDAADYLRSLGQQDLRPYDVIYLDPMYAQTGRKALPKKEMQLVRLLTSGDEDADDLLPLALRAAKRVVVKRAPHAVDMAGQAPAHRVTGKSVRYDVYLAN